jgi:chromosome segregation ATPase
MNNNNEDGERTLDITELPTGEYPALIDGGCAGALNGAEEPHAAVERLANERATTEQDAADKASFWLAHLESEVARLHAKWQTIDAEFKHREARAAELQHEIEAREATIAKLRADLQREAGVVKSAEQRLTTKEAELVALAEQQRTRDERIAALSTELAQAEVTHSATLAKLERADAETARLTAVLRQEQAAAADIAQQNQQLLAEQTRLHGKLQDLEIYINGRHDRWAELNAKLADYKDALAGMEQTVQARDAANAKQDDENRQLAVRIQDLERQCSELAGRRKEREEAYDELQRRLATHFEQAEQRKSEHANRLKELEQAAKTALANQHQIESLEGDIKRRDERIETLNAEAEQAKGVISELTSSNSELTSRVDALDKDLAERSKESSSLHNDLRTTREQLATLEAHASELGTLRAAALAEVAHLKRELAVEQEAVARLTSELRAKQATADLLERSVGRITDLGASLAALDHEMKSGPGDGAPTATDGGAGALLPIDSLLDDENDHDAGEHDVIDAGRKLVATIGGEAIQYPIVKNLMTIGRGHESDIRIASHFVSRIHAKISSSGTATVIEDAGSRNGILVNSERVQRRVLRHGDVVNIGEMNLRFVDAMH